MTTPRTRALVSLTVPIVAATLALGACAGAPRRARQPAPAPAEGERDFRHLTIRFDNDEREYVHVYLIGDQRQWLLGRVEPGAVATLRIPEEALAAGPGGVRLAVVAGERVTLQVARDPRAMLTMAQPASAIVAQQWKFAQGQLTALWARGAR